MRNKSLDPWVGDHGREWRVLSAHQKNAAICTLIHRPLVLRVFGLHVRFVDHYFKAHGLNYFHKVLVARLYAVLRLTVAVMVQQRSQVDPQTARLQDTEKARELKLIQSAAQLADSIRPPHLKMFSIKSMTLLAQSMKNEVATQSQWLACV